MMLIKILGKILGPCMWFSPILNQLDAARQLRGQTVHNSLWACFRQRDFSFLPLERLSQPLTVARLWVPEPGTVNGEFHSPVTWLKGAGAKFSKICFETLPLPRRMSRMSHKVVGFVPGPLLEGGAISVSQFSNTKCLRACEPSRRRAGGPEVFGVTRSLGLSTQGQAWEFPYPKSKGFLKSEWLSPAISSLCSSPIPALTALRGPHTPSLPRELRFQCLPHTPSLSGYLSVSISALPSYLQDCWPPTDISPVSIL